MRLEEAVAMGSTGSGAWISRGHTCAANRLAVI